MPTFMQPFAQQTYALMRIVTGLLFLWHGTQKLFAYPLPPPPVPPFVIYIAGPIELVGGFLVMVGLYAGWAAFLCSGLMALPIGWSMAPRRSFPFKTVASSQHYIALCSCTFHRGAQASGASMPRLAKPGRRDQMGAQMESGSLFS
jgi:putative oxidoreductase